MERIREARRHDTAAGGGAPSKRRHSTTALRDSPEEGPRDRVRRERDRDSSDMNKRQRVERFMRASNGERGEASTEESVGGEEDDEMENRGSISYHCQRKSSLSAGVSRPQPPPESTAVDEIVGVAVPRKARSSSVKRSHDFFVSGNVSASPNRRSCEAISPATSNLSAGMKMKGTPKSSSESQENIEIEIAEVLYGLMKQSKNSKDRFAPNSSQKLESNNSNCAVVASEQPTKTETPQCDASVHVTSVSMEIQKEVVEQESSRPMNIESGDGIGSTESIVMPKEESPSCPTVDNDFPGLTTTKGISTVLRDQNQQEKSYCNMKVNPALASSRDKIGSIDLRLEPELAVQDSTMSKEVAVGFEETKMKSVQEKRILLTIDLEKDGEEQDQKQQRQAEPTVPKKEKTVPPNSIPVWARSLLSLGSQSTTMSIDGNTETSKALQPPHFPLSQPRAKRCTTHHHIARNIYLHQQFLEMNKFRPASVYDTTPCNLSLMLPPNPSLNVSSTNGEGQGHARDRSEKDKSIGEATNSTDNIHRKQFVFQHKPGPALFFPISPNQAAEIATTAATQPGAPKSISSINNPSSASNSAARAPPTPAPLPPGDATLSFNYPIIAPNGYPMAPAMPYFNGTFYSPQMFHPSQLHQQHPQPITLSASTGSSSPSPSLSQKKPQPWGAQSNGHNGTMQMKHAQKQLNPPPEISNGTKQRQHQSSKGGVELVPQTFTVSFAPPNGNAMASNINFSSVPHNPALFQNLPQAAKQGYQVIAAGQMAQQRHYQESKPVASGKPSPSALTFKPPPVIGNWPSCSITTSAPAVPNPPGYQRQSNRAASASASMSARFQNSPVIFSQAPNQSQSPQWKMSSAPNTTPTSASSRARTTPQGQTQISFAGAASVSESPNPRPASSTPALQQNDRTSQKPAPVCGRNVASILMSPPGNQLSELKH